MSPHISPKWPEVGKLLGVFSGDFVENSMRYNTTILYSEIDVCFHFVIKY